MLGIAAAFAALEDPRRSNARRHKLLDILVIAFCASLCGAESCVDMADLAEAQQDVLREFLDLEGGPPSPDTFSRVFRLLNPASFAACFQAYLEQVGAVCQGHIAIDGKTLRGAHDRAAGASPLQMVSAFASETRLTLGQIAVEAQSNEIPAVRALAVAALARRLYGDARCPARATRDGASRPGPGGRLHSGAQSESGDLVRRRPDPAG